MNTVINKYNGSELSGREADVYGQATDALAKAQAFLDSRSPAATAAAIPPAAPAASPVANPALNFDFSGGNGADSIIANLRREAGDTASTGIDEDQIRRNTLQLFQKEIDATNNIYDGLVSDQRVANANNEGGLRSVQNRQGLIGSGRGQTQTTEQREAGGDAISAIQNERGIKISNILGLARKEALDEITAKRTAKQAGADSYLSYIELEGSRKDKRVSNLVSALVSQGIDPSEMTQEEIGEIANNLGVTAQDVLISYNSATEESRAAAGAQSREAAIVGLVNQGVKDPKELFDLVNYDEAGNKVGDVSLAEITAVTEALIKDPDAFNLSQGQARYVRKEDGTYERIAYNPKTYAPSTGGSGGFGGGLVPYEQWKDTITNDSQINGALQKKRQELGRELNPQEAESVLQAEYQRIQPTQVGDPLDNLTQTNKRDISQAGLENADPLAQSYFLNTDASFRDFYSRGVASGSISANASLDQVDQAYTEWFEAKESESSSGDPFAGKSTAELLELLNSGE